MGTVEWLTLAAVVVPTAAAIISSLVVRRDVRGDISGVRSEIDGSLRGIHGDIHGLRDANEKAHSEIGQNINRAERELGARIDVLDQRDRRRAKAAVDAILD